MPVTRSSVRSLASSAASRMTVEVPTTPSKVKRKATSEPSKSSQKKNRVASASTPAIASVSDGSGTVLIPAVLKGFTFQDARQHLISVDGRFEDIFDKLLCRPFENLEQGEPFRALVESILGQQISWMAARSIKHRFLRLYNPSLPEKAADYTEAKSSKSFFPAPAQVAGTDVATLKTAGLSTRKAEYVQDLAARFADGRLSTEKLVNADDEELARMLIEVRGIGRWTVDMFAIFTLRRPDILPIGDLGVQRGMLRWFLSLHAPSHGFSISPDKITRPASEKVTPTAATKRDVKAGDDGDVLPVFGRNEENEIDVALSPLSSVPLEDGLTNTGSPDGNEFSSLPPPFTPSINKTLNKSKMGNVPPLPEGLTVSVLKSRLEGKKKIKGAFLTPKEMEELTESWKPYRSIGVYYMWALVDDK